MLAASANLLFALSPFRLKSTTIQIDEGRKKIRDIFKIYKQLNGKSYVPKRYVVPASDAWPLQYHSFRLGEALQSVKKVYISRKTRHERVWQALLRYKELFGTFLVPRKFVVPADTNEWPKELWKIKLGSVFQYHFYHASATSGLKEKIIAHSPEMGQIKRLRPHQHRVLEAMKQFKELQGHLRINEHFVVPNTAEWPAELHWFKLGSVAKHLRNYYERADPKSSVFIAQLNKLGFVFSLHGTALEHFSLALDIYKSKNGTYYVPCEFVVPENDYSWPKDLWSFNLGEWFHRLRQKHGRTHYAHIYQRVAAAEPETLLPKQMNKFDYDMVLMCQAFKQQFGHVRVPLAFRVPDDDELWPKKYHGKQLGKRVQYLRLKATPAHPFYEALRKLGLSFKCDMPREKNAPP